MLRGNRFLEFEPGPDRISHLLIGEAAPGKGGGVSGIGAQGAIVIQQRLIVLTPIAPGVPPADIVHADTGAVLVGNLDRLVLIGERLVEVALRAPVLAARTIALRDCRIGPNGLGRGGDRPVVIAAVGSELGAH